MTTKDKGRRAKDQGRRTKDPGPRIKDGGPRAKGEGPGARGQGRRPASAKRPAGQVRAPEREPAGLVIIVGCGRIGSALAHHLYKAGHTVAVVDQAAAAFKNLPPDFIGRMVQGDALARDVLRRAGIEKATGLAAVTNSDSVNAVVGHVAQTEYHLPHVVVRNYDPAWRSLHEAFGLQVVSSPSWGVQRIEALLSDASLRVVFSAGNAEVEIYELAVPASWQGRRLCDLLPEDDCRVAALTRAGQAMLPSADIVLEAGDVICLSATLEAVEALRQRMEAPQED